MKEMQLKALKRWEFEKLENGEYYTVIDNLEIQWSVEHQHGACIIDGELSLIHDWDTLDNIMEQTAIY